MNRDIGAIMVEKSPEQFIELRIVPGFASQPQPFHQHAPRAKADKGPDLFGAKCWQIRLSKDMIESCNQIGRGIHQRAVEVEDQRYPG